MDDGFTDHFKKLLMKVYIPDFSTFLGGWWIQIFFAIMILTYMFSFLCWGNIFKFFDLMYPYFLRYAERKVEIHGVKVCSGVPILSHLLFANECFSFCKIVHKETNCLNTILDKYGRASSQVINLDKSEVFFSTNTNQSLRQWTMISLGVSSTIGTCN